MFEALTPEIVLSVATASVSALAILGIIVALRATRERTDDIDVEALVEAAPYQRLHNIIRIGSN